METQPVRAYKVGECKTKLDFWTKFLRVWELINNVDLTDTERNIMSYALELDSKDPFHGIAVKKVLENFNISIHTLYMHKASLRRKEVLTKEYMIVDTIKKASDTVKAKQRYSLEIPVRFTYVETN
mgnify:CR=1 FL=1